MLNEAECKMARLADYFLWPRQFCLALFESVSVTQNGFF